MAGLPELDMVRARRWADEKLLAHVRDEIRLEAGVRGKYVTIFETRPPWHPGCRARLDPAQADEGLAAAARLVRRYH